MRLLRVGPRGNERPAALASDGSVRDLSGLVDDIDGALLADDLLLARVRTAIEDGGLPAVASDVRIGAPVARPGKVIGIGLNYRCHADALGSAVPEQPIVFLKPSSSLVGPEDPIEPPTGSTTTDYEAELGVVLGRHLRRSTDPESAARAVGGYLAANDVTDRALAAEGPTWAKGKCCDTFTPVGPWLVTADALDPGAVALALRVNGELRQQGTTGDMVFGVGELLHHLSQLMTLEPGDLVLTGTPAGVATMHPDPKPFLRDGDVVTVELAGLGTQRTPVHA